MATESAVDECSPEMATGVRIGEDRDTSLGDQGEEEHSTRHINPAVVRHPLHDLTNWSAQRTLPGDGPHSRPYGRWSAQQTLREMVRTARPYGRWSAQQTLQVTAYTAEPPNSLFGFGGVRGRSSIRLRSSKAFRGGANGRASIRFTPGARSSTPIIFIA